MTASFAADHVELQKAVSLALDVLLLGTSPVCDVCIHPIALAVHLQSPCAREMLQLLMEQCDMHVLAHFRQRVALQQHGLVYNVACRDPQSSALKLVVLSISDTQTVS